MTRFFSLLAALFIPCFLFAQLIPALDSPDENSHLARADMLAHGQTLLQTSPPGTPIEFAGQGGYIDEHFGIFIVYASLLANKQDVQGLTYSDAITRAAAVGWAGKLHYFPSPGTGYYFPAIYLPHAAALWMARALDLSIFQSYNLVRAATILTCLCLLLLAFSEWKPNALSIGILAMPMTVFQILSPTIDGITICLAVLFLSLVHAQTTKKSPANLGRFVAICICGFLLVTTRTYLLPILALPFYLAWRSQSRRQALAALVTALACMAWIAFALSATVDLRIPREHTTGQAIEAYLYHPQVFLEDVVTTLSDFETRHFYWVSFIGMLGWLSLSIPFNDLVLISVGLAVLGAASAAPLIYSGIRDLRLRLVLLVLAAASFLLIFFALAVTWNKIPIDIISGVQGRYFIIPALLAASALGNSWHANAIPAFRVSNISILFLCVGYSIYSLGSTLVKTYHLLPALG